MSEPEWLVEFEKYKQTPEFIRYGNEEEFIGPG
jgi:hypothetical protein